MEPSFWSWEKPRASTRPSQPANSSQWSPAFGAGKSTRDACDGIREDRVAMEPSFWSWEKYQAMVRDELDVLVAMEPSFWSWEKTKIEPLEYDYNPQSQWSPAFGAGKRPQLDLCCSLMCGSQWSPAFGAGKR